METTFNALSEILAEERRYFTDGIENSFQEQSRNNTSKKSEIQDEASKLSSLIHSIEISSQNDSKEVFLASITQKKQTIEHAKGVITSFSPHPVKVPEIEMNLLDPTEFKGICHMKNFVYLSEDPLKSHFDRSVALHNKCVPIMDPFKVNVLLAPNLGKTFKAKKIVSQLSCTYKIYSQKVNIEQISPEKYSLSVTPQKRGNHNLHIEYDGAHICGSPIPIYVTVDPREIAAVGRPQLKSVHNAVSIKSKDQKIIYMTQNEETLLILENTSLDIMKTLKLPGVYEALLVNEYLFYTDIAQHRVVKADLNGTTISSIGTRGDQPGLFNFPNGIRLSKDGEIFVCDSGNNRIQVFDRDLKLLRVIANFGFPADLDFDEAGNIYVVEIKNHRVQVLTPQGQHIRNIGRYGSGKGELHRPISAAIHRDMVYVTDRVNKRISVFTTTGDFITTFGEGILTLPECIAIDDNGHIFVTDNQIRVVKF